jgi:hypothetical protein
MTKKQKPKAEAKPSRSRSLAPRSEHPAKAVMRELLAARQEDRAAIQGLVEQVAVLTAIVIAGQVPVPLTMFDRAKALTVAQACHVLGDVDENRLYNRSDLKPVAGTLYVDADALRADYPDRFDEARFEQIKVRNAEPRKKDRTKAQKLLSRKTGN